MNNKAILILFVIVLSMLLSCSNKNNSSQMSYISEDSIISLIFAKENATLNRWYNGDPMGFVDNSWEDVTYFDASIGSRADSIDALRNLLLPIKGLVHVPSHKMDKPSVRVYGDIAILTFTDVFALGEKTARWHASEIYQRRGDEWKLIHSHWTESNIK